jgi:hypothetical protein
MSLIKAVKWFAIYVLLTLVFTAVTALGTFIYVRVSAISYEFNTMFFFFLFLTGLFIVACGAFIILRIAKLTFPEDMFRTTEGANVALLEAFRYSKVRTERRYGILLMLVGLTLILVSIIKLWI